MAMFKELGHKPEVGQGCLMQVMPKGDVLFAGSMLPGVPTTLVDIKNPSVPRIIGQLPVRRNTVSTKVQIYEDLMLVNYEQRGDAPAERAGLGLFDVSNPREPREIGFYNSGGHGVHKMWHDGGRYAYLSAWPEGYTDRIFMVLDVSDPSAPVEAGRWCLPEQILGPEAAAPQNGLKFKLHHALVYKNRAYLGYWDAGLIILDITIPMIPELLVHKSWAPAEGKSTHTAMYLPGRELLAVTDEALRAPGEEPPKYLRIFKCPWQKEAELTELSRFREDAPAPTQGRYGPHNLHENRTSSFISEDLIFLTYFEGGLLALDITDPALPRVAGRFVPGSAGGKERPALNDVYVDKRGLAFVSDRVGSGLYVLEMNI